MTQRGGTGAGTDDIGLSTEPATVFILGGSMIGGGVGAGARRTATSRGGPLRQPSKRDEARRHVDEGAGWLTEGFDTSNLKDARARREPLRSA